MVRLGATAADMPELAGLIARAMDRPEAVAAEVTAWRRRFRGVHFTAG